MVGCGQRLIGVSLGTRFTRAFVHTAPRYLAVVAGCTLVMMLATSPGGIAEMSLTARVPHLGVPVVTAFHVARMVFVVLTIGPLHRGWKRLCLQIIQPRVPGG